MALHDNNYFHSYIDYILKNCCCNECLKYLYEKDYEKFINCMGLDLATWKLIPIHVSGGVEYIINVLYSDGVWIGATGILTV